jgi:hypothetical protein
MKKRQRGIHNVIVKWEKQSENGYKITYQTYNGDKAIDLPYYSLVTKNEYELLMMREILIKEFKVPVDFVDKVIDKAKETQLEDVKEWKYG